eukprot:GHUV01005362.1.p2 GENE.GHUV01005362.1~~GHUV01005362.1.p2  ORF type:complete len:149 (+),score=39.43 GHUV01005362.1:839-1285(+)
MRLLLLLKPGGGDGVGLGGEGFTGYSSMGSSSSGSGLAGRPALVSAVAADTGSSPALGQPKPLHCQQDVDRPVQKNKAAYGVCQALVQAYVNLLQAATGLGSSGRRQQMLLPGTVTGGSSASEQRSPASKDRLNITRLSIGLIFADRS